MTDKQLQDIKPHAFAERLKAAREAMGLERKDVAAQLRLNEKFIIMMEKDKYPSDLPVTFIRGYLRSYAKFLQIPDFEIKKAIEPIKAKPTPFDIANPITMTGENVTSSSFFMQFVTYLILFTLLALVAMWWYTHSNNLFMPITAESRAQPAVTPTAVAVTPAPAPMQAPTPVMTAQPAAPMQMAPLPIEPTEKRATHDTASRDGMQTAENEEPSLTNTTKIAHNGNPSDNSDDDEINSDDNAE